MNPTAIKLWPWLVTDLRRLGVAISILLSIWVILTNDTINVDGILYLDAAQQIKLGNWREALGLYRWPFYPLLIAGVSKITLLGLEPAAWLISTMIFSGIVWLFLTLLGMTGASRPVMIAGLVIICIHPYMNEYRADVLRGPGYWFLLLWSVIHLIRLQETQRWTDGLLWGLTITAATLFRIDGVVYILLAPVALLVGKDKGLKLRANNYFKAMSIPSGFAVIAVAGILSGLLPKGRLHEPVMILNKLIAMISSTIPSLGDALVKHVLNPMSSDYGTVGVYTVLLTIFILTVIKRSTILIVATACYALIDRSVRTKIAHLPVLLWMTGINLFTLIVFVFSKFFLSSRFAMPTALILALFAAYGLAAIFSNSRRTPSFKWRFIKYLATAVLVIMSIDGLISTGASKYYLRDAGYWLQENMKPGEKLLTNHNVVRHYSGVRHNTAELALHRKFTNESIFSSIISEKLKNIDYLAIRTKLVPYKILSHFELESGCKPIKIIGSGKRSVLIYRLSNQYCASLSNIQN